MNVSISLGFENSEGDLSEILPLAEWAQARRESSKNDATNPLFHQCDVEIQKQAEPHSGKLQIGQ